MMSRYAAILLGASFLIGSVSLSADRGDHRDHGGRIRQFWEAWDTLTHPGTPFAKGQVVKNSEGYYLLTLKGADFAATALFPTSPSLKEGGKDSVRYQAFSPKSRTVYSLIFVSDRSAAGFAASAEDARSELIARFQSLEKGMKLEPIPALTKEDQKIQGRLDNTHGFRLTPQVSDERADLRRRPDPFSIQVAERVIIIDKAMVIALVAGRDLGKEASNFLEGVDLMVNRAGR